jgi:molybdate transport system substrate-binding protein
MVLSVAISMKEAVETLGRQFMQSHSGVKLRYNFGSTGELQKQIEAGAPVDVFISAAQRQMDELEQKGLINPATRRVFARNVLTVIKPTGSTLDISKPADLSGPKVQRIVIGNPKTVPVGQYAEESLKSLGLDYVARGEVEAGFVYTTDVAVRSGQVVEAFRPAEDTYRPVTYPAAVIKASKQPALAQAFVDLLVSSDGQAVLSRLGFQPPPPGAR